MSKIVKENETRPASAPSALLVPLDWEDRALDASIRALDDIAEMDEAQVFIKWNAVPGCRVKLPLLYVLFHNKIADGRLPRVHLDDRGVMRPAHAVCLAAVSSSRGPRLFEGEELRRRVREGVEQYLRHHNVRDVPRSGPLPGPGRGNAFSTGKPGLS